MDPAVVALDDGNGMADAVVIVVLGSAYVLVRLPVLYAVPAALVVEFPYGAPVVPAWLMVPGAVPLTPVGSIPVV